MNTPLPNTFHPANAAQLCAASAAAYSTPDSDSCILDSRSDTLVRLTRTETDTIIAFRGTTDLRNWLTDLDCTFETVGRDSSTASGAYLGHSDFEPSKTPIRIHRGFARALSAVEGEITSEVFASCRESRRIWLTGHSLGGALAMLYAWRFFISYRENPFSGIYTYGQPRVGNPAFRDTYNATPELLQSTFRIIHANDLIPRVPWLLGAYRHAGTEVFFPGPPLAFSLQPSALTKLPYVLRNTYRELLHGQLPLLADHHVSTYQALFSGQRTLAFSLSPESFRGSAPSAFLL
jgi:hypothetical protein